MRGIHGILQLIQSRSLIEGQASCAYWHHPTWICRRILAGRSINGWEQIIVLLRWKAVLHTRITIPYQLQDTPLHIDVHGKSIDICRLEHKQEQLLSIDRINKYCVASAELDPHIINCFKSWVRVFTFFKHTFGYIAVQYAHLHSTKRALFQLKIGDCTCFSLVQYAWDFSDSGRYYL